LQTHARKSRARDRVRSYERKFVGTFGDDLQKVLGHIRPKPCDSVFENGSTHGSKRPVVFGYRQIPLQEPSRSSISM